MKLDKQNWKKVEFGQVINHIEINERDPDKRLNAKYVSVEHLTTLDLRIKGVAAEEQPTFSRTFNEILEKNYPDAKWVIEDYSEMGERLAFTIKFQDNTDIIIN